MNTKISFAAVSKFVGSLSDAEAAALANNQGKVKKFLAGLAKEKEDYNFFSHIDDKDLPDELELTVSKWRKLAAEQGYDGPVAWRVREGFTLKEHAPKMGKVYEDFKYLQDWKLQNDEPTQSCIVFWIPRLLRGSKSQNVDQQKALMAETRMRHGLPEHHLSSFGSAALITGLVLAHFARKGERTPLNREWARTDTLHVDGDRLSVGDFGEAGPGYYGWDGRSSGFLGFFALGVELGK